MIGKTRVMYDNMNKYNESVDNSSLLYQSYDPTVI